VSGSQHGTTAGGVAAAISNEVVRVLHMQTGRGPTFAKTTITGDLVVCVLADTLTVGERTLVESGHEEAVLDTRNLHQRAMRALLTAAVEAHTGRKVIGFMSGNHIDPDTAIEAFILEPRAAPDAASATSGD
jgi:uncharacterized protein YbcI